MSYDIYFCWQKDERLDFEEVAAWAEEFGTFKRQETQLWYDNPITGVYFSIDFEAGKFDDPEDNIIPTGYFSTGLSFNLNFNRPSFFGHEAMPFVDALSKKLHLCIFDPQQNDDLALRCNVDSSVLVESWLKSNRWAISALAQDPKCSKPTAMSLESSMYFWRYMRGKADLQKACGEGLFVPTVMPVKKKGSDDAGTAAVITSGIPSIVPQSDWVFVCSTKRHLLRKETSILVVTHQEFLDLTSGYLKTFDWGDVPAKVIPPESAKGAEKILNSIQSRTHKDEFEGIASDSFVDVDLSLPN